MNKKRVPGKGHDGKGAGLVSLGLTILLALSAGQINSVAAQASLSGRGPSVLSPLSSFLPGWGLTGTDENAVIDAILANIQLRLASDIKFNGSNPTFDIELLNSRDHADTFGQADVSRVIIGGTSTEVHRITS